MYTGFPVVAFMSTARTLNVCPVPMVPMVSKIRVSGSPMDMTVKSWLTLAAAE